MDILSLKDKIAIITGASSGIGAEISVLFSKHAANLVLLGRNEIGLNETIEKCDKSSREKIVKILGDVRNSDVLNELVNKALEKFGKIDILINNAGTGGHGDGIETMEMKHFDELHAVNLRSVIELTHLCIPHLIKQKGSIVNVSSIAGSRSISNMLSYSLSKSALNQFTKCISLEVASKGVRVNSVNPGVIPTNIQKRSKVFSNLDEFFEKTKKLHPMQRNGTVEDVAKAVLFLASDGSSFTTGEIIHIDGGLHNVCCEAMVDMLPKKA